MKIDGKKIAQSILDNLKKQIKKLKEKNIYPKLAIILVGNDPSSIAYVNRKEIKAKEIGIKTDIQRFPENISQDKLLKIVKQYNRNKNIHGIIIQQPLPKHLNASLIIDTVSVNKDVDGFLKKSRFEPPLALAVLEILKEVYVRTPGAKSQFAKWLKNKKTVVIGKGEAGGKPIIAALKKLGVKPSIIDSKTINHELLTKNADLIISAVGKPDIIKNNMLKQGIILIGVGLHRDKNGNIKGDYSEEEIKGITSFYTPTPGGIGPVNVAMLLKNVLNATK